MSDEPSHLADPSRESNLNSANPYEASDLSAAEKVGGKRRETETGGNPYIEYMFYTQKVALGFVFGNLLLVFLMQIMPPLPSFVYQLASTAGLSALCVFWYFVFRAASWNHNHFIGFGHAIISAGLTPCLLVGLFVIPILIRGDAERLADDAASEQ